MTSPTYPDKSLRAVRQFGRLAKLQRLVESFSESLANDGFNDVADWMLRDTQYTLGGARQLMLAHVRRAAEEERDG